MKSFEFELNNECEVLLLEADAQTYPDEFDCFLVVSGEENPLFLGTDSLEFGFFESFLLQKKRGFACHEDDGSVIVFDDEPVIDLDAKINLFKRGDRIFFAVWQENKVLKDGEVNKENIKKWKEELVEVKNAVKAYHKAFFGKELLLEEEND